MFVWGLGLESRDPTRTLTATHQKSKQYGRFRGLIPIWKIYEVAVVVSTLLSHFSDRKKPCPIVLDKVFSVTEFILFLFSFSLWVL